MTYDEAKDMAMPFGKYKGKTLAEIAEADVMYLDWLNDGKLYGQLKPAVEAACEQFAHEIEAKMAEREGDHS